jgi:hypothetical protein
MKKHLVMVKKVLMSIATAIVFAFGFTSCTDDDVVDNTQKNQAANGAKAELLEAYGLTYQNFINADDVMILDADTTQLSVSKAYAEKMGISSFVNHPMGIWQKVDCLPYIRKATAQKTVGDRYILDVVPATMSEIVGDKKVDLQTDIYVNKDANAVKTRAAADNIPEYAAKYVDDNNVVHPAVVLMTDPYGYDKDVHYEGEQPSAAQTRAAQSGEYQYLTAEEIAAGQTRWSTNLRLLNVNTELSKTVKFAAKNSKDSLEVEVGGEIDFGLNYFLTIEGGIKWNWCVPSPYVKKFETGVDGHFDLDSKVMFRFKKEFDLEDKLKCDLAKFPGYTFTFFIGPIPVAITISPNMFVKMDGKVSGCVEMGFTYKYGNKFKGGVSYDNGKWDTIKGFEETANKFDIIPAQVNFSLETGVGLYLGADILVYGAAGPEFAVGPRLGGKLQIEGIPFKAPKEVADLYNIEGMINLTINAVVGAKLKVLGYELAETHFTIPLLKDKDGWVLFKFPFDPEKDEVHKSPDAKKEEEQVKALMPKLLEVLTMIQQKTMYRYLDYEKVIHMMMDMKGLTHDQAEEEFLKKLLKDMPSFETSEDMNAVMAGVLMRLTPYYNELEPKHKAFMAEKSWKDVQQTLLESPAYDKLSKYFADYYNLKIDLNLVRAEFKKDHGREAAMAQADIEALIGYMQSTAKLYCQNNANFMKQFDPTIVPYLIKYGNKGISEHDRECAAYETLLAMKKKYRNTNFTKIDWNQYVSSSVASHIRWTYSQVEDIMVRFGR